MACVGQVKAPSTLQIQPSSRDCGTNRRWSGHSLETATETSMNCQRFQVEHDGTAVVSVQELAGRLITIFKVSFPFLLKVSTYFNISNPIWDDDPKLTAHICPPCLGSLETTSCIMLRCSPGTHRFPVSASVRGSDVANPTPLIRHLQLLVQNGWYELYKPSRKGSC